MFSALAKIITNMGTNAEQTLPQKTGPELIISRDTRPMVRPEYGIILQALIDGNIHIEGSVNVFPNDPNFKSYRRTVDVLAEEILKESTAIAGDPVADLRITIASLTYDDTDTEKLTQSNIRDLDTTALSTILTESEKFILSIDVPSEGRIFFKNNPSRYGDIISHIAILLGAFSALPEEKILLTISPAALSAR